MIEKTYRVNSNMAWILILDWLIDTYGTERGGYTFGIGDRDWSFYRDSNNVIHVKFRYEKDFTWFILRWSGDLHEGY